MTDFDTSSPRPRGAHFARTSSQAADVEDAQESHVPGPDETTAFLLAAGVDPGRLSSKGKRFASPAVSASENTASGKSDSGALDETVQFILAAGTTPRSAGRVQAPSRPTRNPVPEGQPSRRVEQLESNDGSQSDEPQCRPSVAGSDDDDDMSTSDYEKAGRSAGMMTGLILVSRLTGFVRTWAMGAALGLSLLSSSYQIAYNLPSMLYELVIGGMLITAFLPVYMEVRRERGKQASNEYVGNLLGILLLILGVVAALATIGAPAVIWTQSFMSANTGQMDTAIYLFRFFAVEILFFGLGSVFSGVLNAHRDYFWSNFAPVLNNVVVIASFAAFYVMDEVFHVDRAISITMLAIGTTLGVFIQMACQIPALRRHGVVPRLHVDFRDPNLRKTLALGIPTLAATVCAFVNASVQNAAALSVQPETGASVVAYSRLWYTLPYALFAVPITTALYTELARDAARHDDDAVRAGVARGVSQMLFILIPFALYLIVFSYPLNMVYCVGKFGLEGVALVSEYLCFLAPALPIYGVCVLLQKSCSALMDMKPYAFSTVVGTVALVSMCLVWGANMGGGIPIISLSTSAFYVVAIVITLAWMRRRLRGVQLGTMARGLFFGLVLGGLGAAAGVGMMQLLQMLLGPIVIQTADGAVAAPILKTVTYIAVSGIVAMAVTFVPGIALKLPEAGMFTSILGRFTGRRAS